MPAGRVSRKSGVPADVFVRRPRRPPRERGAGGAILILIRSRSKGLRQPVTLAFRARLEAEVRELEEELHLHLPKQIKEAREHGDLSENAEYEAAKERQAYVAVRLAQLKGRLADLSMVSMDNIPADRISLGSEVVVVDLDTDEELRYELVVSEGVDPAAGKVSTGSPIGRALMGARVGDEVSVHTPVGEREFAIRELRTIHDRDSS